MKLSEASSDWEILTRLYTWTIAGSARLMHRPAIGDPRSLFLMRRRVRKRRLAIAAKAGDAYSYDEADNPLHLFVAIMTAAR